MKTLHFSTTIRAPREHVWRTLVAPDTFRLWTAEFTEGSHFEGSWEEGERIRFLAPGGSGMTSVIAQNRKPEFLSIKHLGFVHGGVDDTRSESVRSWAPAFENYTLTQAGKDTELMVDVDVTPDFEAHMAKTFPKALAKLKAICEETAAG